MAKKKEAPVDPFVPAEEQPYPIPENWCWVKLGNLYEINPKITADDTILASFVPMERIGAGMTGRFTFEIQPWGKARKNHTQFADGDVAFAKISPCFENQKSMMVQGLMNGIGGGTTELIILRQAQMNQKYTFLLVSTEDFISRGKATYSGTVGQQRISMDFVKAYPVPVPPLPEQHRIVTRIESLFAKLDEAKEKTQAVVDGFELRKSAILHKAFTGELTERWRKEHGVGLDSWETKRINEIAKPRAGYAFDSKKFTNSGYQIIRMGNLYGGELDLSRNPVFISLDDVDETALKRALVNDGDILITLTGTKYKRDYGYAVSILNPTNLLVNQRILCLTPCQGVEKNYILYYLRSNIFRDIFFSNETGGVNQGNVSSKFVESIEVKVPLLAEQHEMVTILNRMMDKEQQAKEAAEAALAQIDTMKKAILARAFRGELGTNDPAEKWAGEMVKAVL